jgi:hypothetical protein
MPALNWGLIQDGGVLESLMHAILYAKDPQTILFGRPGKDAGQDARTADGATVYQAKYRDGMDMDEAVKLALAELKTIKKYRDLSHANHEHWKNATRWVLFANLSINPNDDAKWMSKVVSEFAHVGLGAEYWTKQIIEGKLAEQPQVRDVFFGQENRVLVGLKEAHDLLKNERIGSDFLDTPMLGRDTELVRVKEFINSPDKRVLPVIGPGGIGKSRFLYESLVALSQEGWRVLWGLPAAMAKSSQWFQLLNATQKTCVALDDPEDSGLLRAVIEQLSTVERRNWRVIVSCRTDRSDVLQRYKTNRSVEEAIRLNVLSESDSKALLNSRLGYEADEAQLHKAFRLTQGNPGWICLFAELAKQGKLHELPPKADDIASLYVTTCLERFDGATVDHARIVLRWLALWGFLVFEAGSEEQDEIAFLEQEGITKSALHDILKRLVETGLVRNWGIGKRFYGIDSLLIRQHILSEWLLQEAEPGAYSVSPAGTDLVTKLLSAGLPCIDATLQTISHLSLSRLESQEAYSLLRPIFDAMAATAKDTDLVGQNHIAELVAKLGVADPESALDVLTAIRENAKGDQEVEDSFWGKFTFTRNKLLSTLSWTLFTLAERVDDPGVGHRFLVEFGELTKLVGSDLKPSDPGKSPQQLLIRLLCESRNSGVFARPAFEIAITHLPSGDWWPFVGDLAKCILEPKREITEWIANWTLGVSRYAIASDSPDWERLLSLRATLFEILQSDEHRTLHNRIWPLLSDSHHSLAYANAHYRMRDADRLAYRKALIDDLTMCQHLLKAPRTLGEATLARPMWEWYLEYGQDEALVKPARECERLYSGLSKWRIHDFFRFDYDDELAVEAGRVAKGLRDATDPSDFVDFFDEVSRYLSSARGKSDDMADGMQLGAVADKLADMFSLDAPGSATALSSFVLSVLAAGEQADRYSLSFAIMVCKAQLGRLKANGEVSTGEWLNRLLATTPSKGTVLYRIYSNAHPNSTGPLSMDEVQCVLAHKPDFSSREWFWLIGVFAGAVDDTLLKHVLESLESFGDDRYEASNCLGLFIRSAHLAFRRYERSTSPEFVRSILDWIVTFQLDGALLAFHDLEAMMKRSGVVPDMRYFASLMQSRVKLEGAPKPNERFEILPHRFNVRAWCKFDPTNDAEVSAFHDVCRLALDHTFTATYWIPKYLPELDSGGACVAAFVTRYLADGNATDAAALSRLAYLASQYSADSEAWASIARPICEKAREFGREDREHLYFCLSRKETGVMRSMPGEVPDYYVHTRDSAKRLLDCEPQDSPLRLYREWALKTAEDDLRREEGRAEEMGNE